VAKSGPTCALSVTDSDVTELFIKLTLLEIGQIVATFAGLSASDFTGCRADRCTIFTSIVPH